VTRRETDDELWVRCANMDCYKWRFVENIPPTWWRQDFYCSYLEDTNCNLTCDSCHVEDKCEEEDVREYWIRCSKKSCNKWRQVDYINPEWEDGKEFTCSFLYETTCSQMCDSCRKKGTCKEPELE